MFSDGHVEVEGRRLRYREAGQGSALVHLVSAGGLALTPAHGLLARAFRVVALEIPDAAPGASSIVARALTQLGLETFNLMATTTTAPAALRLALQAPGAGARPGAGVSRRHGRAVRGPGGLATPTLVLLGTLDDGASAAVGRAYQAWIPGCHLAFVYAAGPAIAAERAEAFAEIVADFFERRDAFVISRATTLINP